MTKPGQKGAYVRGGSEKVTIEGVTIGRETDKAVLVTIEGKEVWIPISQIVSMTRTKTEGGDTIVVSEWIAKTKGLTS